MTVFSNSIDRFVGLRLRSQREKKLVGLEQLAEEIGISANELADYEKGAVRLSARLLQKIAERLETPPSYFFQGMAIVSETPAGKGAPESPEATRTGDAATGS